MTSGFDFDTPIDRRSTNSIKWSLGERDGVWLPMPATPGSPEGVDLLPMWLADMDFPTAPAIVAALRQHIEHDVLGYSTYDEEFYEAITGWEGRHGWQPEPSWIVATSGVMPAINLLIQTFTAPGSGVIVQPPVFHPITEAVALNGRRPLPNPLREEQGRYRIDFEDLAAKAADPAAKMMILCSPHNPVGRVWTVDELEAVAAICLANDVLLVSDEIHGDVTYPWAAFSSVGSLGPEHEGNLVVCTGPSKAFNLPALRLGLTIIPDADKREGFRSTLRNQNELWAANALGATALKAAYLHAEPWLDALLAQLESNLHTIEEFISSELPDLRLARPEALYLAWIDCRRLGLSSVQLDRRLRDAGLWLEPGATYGAEGDGFVRMTFATAPSILSEGLQRMARALR